MQFFTRLLPSRDLLRVHNIRWLAASRFFGDLFFYSTVIVLFQSQRGLNFTEMFFMESILSASIWLWNIPTGIWADQFGYQRLILAGRILQVVGMLVFVLAHGFWLFALSNVLGGAGIACITGCESAMVYTSLPPEERETRGTSAFALLTMFSSAAFFLGLASGSFIGAYSPTLAVAISVVPAFLSLFAATRLRPVANPDVSAAQAERVRVRDLLHAALRAMRERPSLVGLSLFESAAFTLGLSIFWYNQPYFARAGIPIVWFGPITAVAQLLALLLTFMASAAQRRLGTRLTLVLSCLVPGLAYMALATTRAPALVALLVVLVAATPAWREPLVHNELNSRITDGSRATALSALSFIGTLSGVLLNPLIGKAGDLGLNMAGVSIGLGLVVLCILVPLVVGKQ